MRIAIILLLSIILFQFQSFGQSTFGIKLKTLSINPAGTPNSEVAGMKLDKDGMFMAEPGLVFSYEAFILEKLHSLVIHQGLYIDGASEFAGFTHLGVKTVIWSRWKHSVNIGAGSTLQYRNSWENKEGYVAERKYSSYDQWQYRLLLLTGGIEYNYSLKDRVDLSASLFFDHAEGVSLAFGYRYWISTRIKHKRSCGCH